MQIDNSLIESLVESENPFPHIWEFMIQNIWQQKKDIKAFYGQEQKMRDFEYFLVKTFDELYTELLPIYCTKQEPILEFGESIVFLDSLSLREGILLKRALNERGISTKLTYSFSALPSGTTFYKEKIEFDELKKKTKAEQIKNIKSWNLKGDEKIIWSDFPDARLESLSEGKTILGTVTEAYEEVEGLVLRLLEKLEAKNLLITSDHGYVRHQAAYSFPMNSRDQKKVRKLLGGKRYSPASTVKSIPQAMETFVVNHNDYYMAKGRYVWPVSGKYQELQHNGVSLLECMTPKLTVER